MTQEGPRLERFLERAVGLGATAGLHPARLLQEVYDAAQASIRDGAVANAYRVELARSDAEFFRDHHSRIEREIVRLLDELAAQQRLQRPGPWVVEFAESAAAAAGSVRVWATYRNPSVDGAAPPAGATQAITRHRGKFLVVEGVGRVPLTHTPFTIGRGRECDLAIPDLAISRKHARIETLADGSLILRDLGSRNLLSVHGGRLGEVSLAPGLRVQLGSTTFWLEVAE